MQSTFGRIGTALALAFALGTGIATNANAQTNVTGTWDIMVTTDGNAPSGLALTLTQAGDSISGQYDSQTFGIAQARGTVTGNQLRVQVPISDPTGQLGGGPLGTVVMTGTLATPTTISGNYALESDLLPLTGTFTGTKRAPGAAAPPPTAAPGG